MIEVQGQTIAFWMFFIVGAILFIKPFHNYKTKQIGGLRINDWDDIALLIFAQAVGLALILASFAIIGWIVII